MDIVVAARDLRKGDIFPGGGEVTRIFNDTPGVVMVEVDFSVLLGPWNHGDPVRILDREEQNA